MALPDIVNMPGDTSPINAALLTRKALDILISDLAGHGNVQSVMHHCALMELLDTFEDKVSGATADRPQLQAALKHCREGDTLVVHSMDRLARNLTDLKGIIESLTGRGVTLEFIKERQTFRPDQEDPMATLMLHLLGAVAEFERDLIKERQREGIAIAKTKGVYKGRAPKLTTEKAQELRAKDAANGGKGRSGLAREYGISRETLYQYLNVV